MDVEVLLPTKHKDRRERGQSPEGQGQHTGHFPQQSSMEWHVHPWRQEMTKTEDQQVGQGLVILAEVG